MTKRRKKKHSTLKNAIFLSHIMIDTKTALRITLRAVLQINSSGDLL